MIVKAIANGVATVSLDHCELHKLAQACDLAVDHLGNPLETYGAAFKAASIAAHGQTLMRIPDHAQLQEELTALDLD